MTIATPALTNFTAGELSPRLYGRVDLSKYFNGCAELENMLVHAHGGVTRRSGMRFVAQAVSHLRPSLLVPFEFNAEQAYLLEFGEKDEGGGVIRVFKEGGQVLSGGEPYELASPYSQAEFARLRHAQSNDTLILVHPAHPPRALTRHDHDGWTLEEIEFTQPPEEWTGENQPSCVCFFENRLVLAATPAQPSTLWFSRSGAYYDFRTSTRVVPVEEWGDLLIRDTNDNVRNGNHNDQFLLYDGESFEAGRVVRGATAGGERRYYRYKGSRGFVAAGADLTVIFRDAPGGGEIEAVFNPLGVLQSQFWEEFSFGERIDTPDGGDPLESDGFALTLSASQANAIEFLVPKSRLWVGTIGGEWSVGGPSSSEPISPATAKANQEGTAGAAGVMPVQAGGATLFIQRGGLKLREMSYRESAAGLASTDLTLLAEHLTEPGLTRLAYAQEPESLVFAVRADGVLLALTYHPDQEVRAWTRLTTNGAVEDAVSVFDATLGQDRLWLVVRRSVDGEERRFIETLDPMFRGGATQDAFFLDCGLSYAGDPVSSLVGLGHLAGEEVCVLADGLVRRGLPVSAEGVLELGEPASAVHVGLPYSSVLRPLSLEGGSQRGVAQTKKSRLTELTVRFHNTLGGKVGADEQGLEPVLYLTSSDPMGKALPLFSGDKRVLFPKGWSGEGRLLVVQDQPLPLSVLMIVPKMIVNE